MDAVTIVRPSREINIILQTNKILVQSSKTIVKKTL